MNWLYILPAIKDRVSTRRRLTLRQGEALYAEYERLKQENDSLRKASIGLEVERDVARQDYDRVSGDWNELVRMLDRVLGCSVDGEAHGHDVLWTARWDGRVSSGHATVAAAFEAVLGDKLHREEYTAYSTSTLLTMRRILEESEQRSELLQAQLDGIREELLRRAESIVNREEE
jgi:hypothetical protein